MTEPVGSMGGVRLVRTLKNGVSALLLRVPLPPSANRRNSIYAVATAFGPRAIVRTRQETRNYLNLSMVVKALLGRVGHQPIKTYTPFQFAFFLSNKNCDTHNCYKAVCDMLQYAGAVANDKHILPVTLAPRFLKSSDDPYLLIGFPLNSNVQK